MSLKAGVESGLIKVAEMLSRSPPSVLELLCVLELCKITLGGVDQSPKKSILDALSPLRKALVSDELLGHPDTDVKVSVACCISEIIRITVPDAPYDDERIKKVFQLIVSSFENLSDKSSQSYNKRAMILETMAKVRSCVIMVDLECDDLITEMFQIFFRTIRDYHPDSIFTSMATIMNTVLEESEEVSTDLVKTLLSSVKRDNKEVSPITRRLGEKILVDCSIKLKPYLAQVIKNTDISLNNYSQIVTSVCGEIADEDACNALVQQPNRGENTQLMEGDDAPSESFKWTIEGFSKLTKKKYSEIFYRGGIGWQLLIFPRGNNVPYLSIYLHAVDSEAKLLDGWKKDAKISFIVVNQIHDKRKVKKDIPRWFNTSVKDRGLKSFMPLKSLNDPTKGYVVNDTCIIEVILEVISPVPSKITTKAPSESQSHKRKTNSLDFFNESPSKRDGSSALRPFPTDLTNSTEVTQSEEPLQKINVSSNEKSPAKGDAVNQENTLSEPLPTLFSQLGSLKLRNPPYSLPNGYRITEGAVLDEGGMAAQLIQSAMLSSELQSLVEMPVVDLASQGYYHLAKFLHYHCASVACAEGLQIKYQEHANVLEEIKSRDLEIQKLQLSLEKSVQEALQLREVLEKAKVKVSDEFSAVNVLDEIKSRDMEIQNLLLYLGKSVQEASQLRGDLEKVVDEKVKVADEFSAAQEKIINLEGELDKVEGEFSASKEKVINLEGELQLLHTENVDLQIQLEDARQAERNAAMRAVEDFKASNEYHKELRAMAFDSLKLATEYTCSHLKNKLPGFEPSMLDNLLKVADSFLTNKADASV